MGKNLGTSAGLITLAAALLFHVGSSRTEEPTRKAGGPAGAAIAITTTGANLAGAESEVEGLGRVLSANAAVQVCKPGADACAPMVETRAQDLEACGMSPVCRIQFLSHWGMQEKSPQVLIASVPDPLQTRLSLFTDTALDALQQAAFDAHWELATQWLPWRPSGKATTATTKKRRGTAQPGLLVFRHSPVKGKFDGGVLLVLLVGESPTAGLNREQFRMARAYSRVLGDPEAVRLVMPCFSGSIASLASLIENDRKIASFHRHQYRVRSGTATNRMLLQAFAGKIDVDIHGTNLNNEDEEQNFESVLATLRIGANQAAVLIEDESAYSKGLADASSPQGSAPTKHPLVLRYPRDISNLRNHYRETADGKAAEQALPEVDFSLKDPDAGEDTLPIYSGEKTPAEQDAVISQVMGQIRRDGIRLVKVSATNVLDLLFLTKVLRIQCPDTRVLVTSPDLLFVKASQQQASLIGTLALAAYPLSFAADHWIGESPLTHSNSNEEGLYYATKLLLLSADEAGDYQGYAWKGQPYPASWLTALDRNGFAPLRLLENRSSNWFERRNVPRAASFVLPRPPAAWILMVSALSLLSLSLCAWILYLRGNQHVVSWSIIAPEGDHIADAHRLTCVTAMLLSLATMQAVLLIPLRAQVWAMPYVIGVVATAIPVGVCCWLAVKILSKPRSGASRWATLATVFVLPALTVVGWADCCYRTKDKAGFFFSFRALEVQPGSSPLLPVLLLLTALLTFAACHLIRFYFAISHRPRLFVAKLDRFFSFKMHNCRRELNRVLVAPMNLSGRQQMVMGGAFLLALSCILSMWRTSRKLASFEGREYDVLLVGLFVLTAFVLVLTTQQMRLAWGALQPLLARLDTLPLRASFPKINDIGKTGPIWVRRLNLQSLAMPTSATGLLRNLEQLSCRPDWDYELTCNAIRRGRMRYTQALSWLLENQAHATRVARRDLFCSLRYQGARLSEMIVQQILVRDWERRLLPSDALPAPEKEKEKDAKGEPDAYQVAQAFVALQTSVFINYGVRQIQNLAFAICLGFGLVAIALSIYTPEAPQAVSHFLLVVFVALGYVLWTVLAQMERDPILSQLSGTAEGELNRTFYFKLIGYGAVPVLGLLSSQFPYIGSFLSSWLEPSLEALR